MLENAAESHTSGAPRKSGAHFSRKNVALLRQDAWKSGDFSKKMRLFHGFQVTF
jgi:hypothetical protein